jgi:hypothetical protein
MSNVAFADHSHLARSRTPKPRITPRVKRAIDAIVETGADYQQAAAQVGLSTYALRLALSKSHVLNYLRQQLQVLRDARGPRNFHRLCEIADRNDTMPAVQALRTLEQVSDEPLRTANAADARGVTIRIINIAPSSTPELKPLNAIAGE